MDDHDREYTPFSYAVLPGTPGMSICTANAGVGVVEYYERRAFGTYLNASRLFLYKTVVVRRILNNRRTQL